MTFPDSAGATVAGFKLVIALPAGMCYVAGSAKVGSVGSALTGAPAPPAPGKVTGAQCNSAGPAPASGGPVTLPFGPVGNVGSSDNAANLALTVTVQVVVLPSASGTLAGPTTTLDIEGCAPSTDPSCSTTRDSISSAVSGSLAVKAPVLAVTASWNVNQGDIGQPAALTVTITNAGLVPAWNVSVDNVITNAGGLSLNAIVSSSCAGGASADGLAIHPLVKAVSAGELPAGQHVTCVVESTISSPQVGSSGTSLMAVDTSRMTVGTTQPVANNAYGKNEAPAVKPATASLPIAVAAASLSVSMVPTGAPFAPGGLATYRVTVTNGGPDPVQQVQTSITLSPGLSGSALAGAGGVTVTAASVGAAGARLSSLSRTDSAAGLGSMARAVRSILQPLLTLAEVAASGDRVAAKASTSSWVWSGFTMSPGQSVSGTFTATVPLGSSGSITGTITAQPIPGFVSPAASARVTPALIQPSFALKAALQRTGTVFASSTSTYTLTVTDAGPSSAGTINLVNATTPAGFRITSASGPGWNCPDPANCSLPSLATGTSAKVTLTAFANVATGASVGLSVHVTAVGSPGTTAVDTTSVQATQAVIAGSNGSFVLGGQAASTGSGASSSSSTASLPVTGANAAMQLARAGSLVLLGVLFVAGSRRRRRPPRPIGAHAHRGGR